MYPLQNLCKGGMAMTQFVSCLFGHPVTVKEHCLYEGLDDALIYVFTYTYYLVCCFRAPSRLAAESQADTEQDDSHDALFQVLLYKP